jgi:hypothetical protein
MWQKLNVGKEFRAINLYEIDDFDRWTLPLGDK